MTQDAQQKIAVELERFAFVRWDRFTSDNGLTVFGWIDRPHDDKPDRKDFIMISFTAKGESDWFMTSSARYSLEIYKMLNDDDGRGHRNCKRVENYFDIKNAIRLEKPGVFRANMDTQEVAGWHGNNGTS